METSLLTQKHDFELGNMTMNFQTQLMGKGICSRYKVRVHIAILDGHGSKWAVICINTLKSYFQMIFYLKTYTLKFITTDNSAAPIQLQMVLPEPDSNLFSPTCTNNIKSLTIIIISLKSSILDFQSYYTFCGHIIQFALLPIHS